MANETAVDWLIENIQKVNKMDWDIVFIQAKEMEKEQIKDAYLNACLRVTPYGYYNNSAEQYYNDTYV